MTITVDEKNPCFADTGGVLFNKIRNRLLCYPAGKKDTHYTIPAGVTAVANHAFVNCESLTAITLPDSLTDIGFYAFSGCTSLRAVYLSRKIPISGDAFENTPAQFFYTD
jgi:hypothetical protein